MFECKQDNPNEFHVYVKKAVLKFTIFEFALISGLNCTSNIEDFQYPISDGSVLMTKYFSVAKNGIFKKKIVERYKMRNFDNDQDALQMTILFFIHTFLLSETDDATVSFIEFNVAEDGRYEQYPWGKIAFNKLMNSLRQDFFYVYTNISPTVDDLKCLQLPNHDGMDLKDSVNSTLPSTSCRHPIKVDQKAKMKIDSLPLDDFDNFTTPPPLELLTKSKARGTYREQVLMKVDMNAIESLVKTYNDDGNAVSTGDHKRDEKSSTKSSKKFNFDDPAIRERLLKFKLYRSTEISSNAFQKSIDNVIAGMYTPVVTMTINSDDLSQKVNLPNPSLKTDNVEVPNEPQESTNDTSTDAFQESIDNIIAEISTPVVAMKMKFISPTEINDNELGDSLSTQDDYKRSCFVANNEESLINIIKGFNIPTTLPWHLVNDVYFSVNCDEKFHWMRAVISVKKRCICMYDSMLSSHYREPSHEIKKLSVMLPTYLNDSGLLENTEQTVWSSLETYTDKIVKWLVL
ncbi:hypothetical protein FXO37_00702 [Capsicum annuum]|nr:hypothetical protein FXO37_00702 [Capsicum annuum]